MGMDHFITIAEASRIAGYRDDHALQAAARKGKLRTEQLGPRARMTTRTWLDEYLVSVKQRGTRRGESKQAAAPQDDAWFYTPEWQAKEREADEAKAAGRSVFYGSDEEFLASLAEPAGAHADIREA